MEFSSLAKMVGPLPVSRKGTKKDGGVAPAVRQTRPGNSLTS